MKSWNIGNVNELLYCYNTGLLIFLKNKNQKVIWNENNFKIQIFWDVMPC
jgi:hypothetical protein